MKFKSLLAFVFCYLVCSPAWAQSEQDLETMIKNVENGLSYATKFKGGPSWTIKERMEHYGVPGLCIAVIKDNKVVWTKAYGLRDRESGEPVETNTLFQCASISKPVSAAAALRMVEQEKFDLDADINNYLREWRLPENEFTREKKVTLRHLVSHTGGLTVHGFPGYRDGNEMPSLTQILDGSGPSNTDAIRVDKTPGGDFRYSGGGYCVMQQMMIEATGKAFPEIMNELVLEPLAMKRSTFAHPLPDNLIANAATGYAPNGKRVDGDRHIYPEMAPAGLYTTASELAQFWIEISNAYQGKSERVLSKQMAHEMLTTVSGRFGLGVGIKDNDGQVFIGHGGWNEGFSSEAGIHRDLGYGLVVLTNGNKPELIDEITASVARAYGWENHTMPEFEKLEVGKDVIAQISGRYDHQGSLIKIHGDDGKLYLSANDSEMTPLYRVGENQFAYETGEHLICYSEKDSNSAQISFKKPWDAPSVTGDIARKLTADEKLAVEWLAEGEFEKALAGFQAQKESTPNQETVSEGRLNGLGYQFLSNKQIDRAIDIFRINVALYPESFNTYDSLGEAYLLNGEKELGALNYRKSLELNPGNENATSILKELESKSK